MNSNDADIQRLVAMAVEVDELEAVLEDRMAIRHGPVDAGDRELIVAAQRHRRQARFGILAALSAAACLLVVGVVSIQTLAPELWGGLETNDSGRGQRSVAVGGTNAGPEIASGQRLVKPDARVLPSVPPPNVNGAGLALAAAEDQCSVVIAMERDASGELRCVRWRQNEWNAEELRGLSVLDMKTAVGPTRCGGLGAGGGGTSDPMALQHLVLLVVSGPTRALPRTDQSAEQLATCILGTPRNCETEGHCFAGGAARCLPPEVSVKIETLSLGR